MIFDIQTPGHLICWCEVIDRFQDLEQSPIPCLPAGAEEAEEENVLWVPSKLTFLPAEHML